MVLKIISALLIICLTEGILARTTNINLQSRENRYKYFLPKRRNDFTDSSSLLIMHGISPRDSNSKYDIYNDNFIRQEHLVFEPYPRGIPQTIINSNTAHNYNSRSVSSALQQPYFIIYVINDLENVSYETEEANLNNDYNTIHRNKRQIPQTMQKIYYNEETPILPLRGIQNVHYFTMTASSNTDINQYGSKIQSYQIQNTQDKTLTYRIINDEDAEAINFNIPGYNLKYFPKNLQVLQTHFEQPASNSNPPYNRRLYKSHQPRRHQINGILSSDDLFISPWHYNNQLDGKNDGRNFLLLRHKFEFPITVREPFQGNSLRYENGKQLLSKLRQDEAFDAYSPRAVTDPVKNSNYDYPYYDFTGLTPHKNVKY